jgi:phage shock protein C
MTSNKKLTRSQDNRWLAGVCGGLGEYFNIDPTIIRVLFVLFTMLFSVFVGGAILYAILWVLIPEQDDGSVSDPVAKVIPEYDDPIK